MLISCHLPLLPDEFIPSSFYQSQKLMIYNDTRGIGGHTLGNEDDSPLAEQQTAKQQICYN